MNRPEKEEQVEALRRDLEGVTSAFLCGFSGLSVPQVTELRAKIRDIDSSYRVIKNRLAARAFEETALDSLREHLRGPLALAFQKGEPVALAKLISEFAKENPALEFKVGILDGKALAADDLQNLANLPSREVLIARFMGAVTAPLAAFQRVLVAPVRDFAAVLSQIAKQKDSE